MLLFDINFMQMPGKRARRCDVVTTWKHILAPDNIISKDKLIAPNINCGRFVLAGMRGAAAATVPKPNQMGNDGIVFRHGNLLPIELPISLNCRCRCRRKALNEKHG